MTPMLPDSLDDRKCRQALDTADRVLIGCIAVGLVVIVAMGALIYAGVAG